MSMLQMRHVWDIEMSGVILTHQVAHTLGLTHDSSSKYTAMQRYKTIHLISKMKLFYNCFLYGFNNS